MNPTVSICIPTYNRKDYLRETLQSVFSQTYKDYEVVVLDDGSTDGTKEMISDAAYDVRYYWVDHMGQQPARNKLIQLANGQYITFVDSDDLLFPDSVENLMGVIDSCGPDIVAYGSYIGIDENGKYVPRKQRKLASGNITAELFEFIHVHSCGTICAKRLFEEVGGFDVSLRRCSVYKLWLELSLRYRFIALDKPVFKRRRHSGNVFDRSFADRKIEFCVLEAFYFNGGGKEVIPQRRAMRRLSKEAYRAGKSAAREEMYDVACELLGQSFRRYPNAKSLMRWVAARVAECFVSP